MEELELFNVWLEKFKKLAPELKIVDVRNRKILSKIFKHNVTLYPRIFMVNNSPISLNHEMVHFLDQKTFFGKMSERLSYLNFLLFLLFYTFPQNLSVLAFLAFFDWKWIFASLFILPIPSITRAFCELRGYRRTLENSKGAVFYNQIVDSLAGQFTKSTYYFMLPFKKLVKKLLNKPSPYKDLFDNL